MKTNYDNLSAFEASTLVIAVVGLALIGCEIYVTLPQTTKTQVSSAFMVFDLHEQFTHVADNAQFVLTTTQDFYDQFNLAFTQVFSFPDAIGTPVIRMASAFSNYTQSMALAYEQNNTMQTGPSAGEILGAMIVNQNIQPVTAAPAGQTTTTAPPAIFQKQYYYHAPAVVQNLFNKN